MGVLAFASGERCCQKRQECVSGNKQDYEKPSNLEAVQECFVSEQNLVIGESSETEDLSALVDCEKRLYEAFEGWKPAEKPGKKHGRCYKEVWFCPVNYHRSVFHKR